MEVLFALAVIYWLLGKLKSKPQEPPTVTITIREIRDDRGPPKPPPVPKRTPEDERPVVPKHEPEILAANQRAALRK